MLHDSDGERRVQVVKSACHLSCAVTVLDVREADLVKYLNWFVDLIFDVRRESCECGMREREGERKLSIKNVLQFTSIYCDNIDYLQSIESKANLSCATCSITSPCSSEGNCLPACPTNHTPANKGELKNEIKLTATKNRKSS